MSGVDIAVIAIVSALFAVALGFIVYRKLKGKSGCDCSDCGACKSCSHCRARMQKNKDKKQ